MSVAFVETINSLLIVALQILFVFNSWPYFHILNRDLICLQANVSYMNHSHLCVSQVKLLRCPVYQLVSLTTYRNCAFVILFCHSNISSWNRTMLSKLVIELKKSRPNENRRLICTNQENVSVIIM